MDGVIICNFTFFAADITFNGREQKSFGGILNGKLKLFGEGTNDIFFEFGLNGIEPIAFGDIDMHTQNAFLFAARDGENLMRH